jgi:hypothetical protein
MFNPEEFSQRRSYCSHLVQLNTRCWESLRVLEEWKDGCNMLPTNNRTAQPADTTAAPGVHMIEAISLICKRASTRKGRLN